MVYVRFAPAKDSTADLRPTITGIAAMSSANSAYTLTISIAFASASSAVACAVCPSCHRNSSVRMNGRVRISQRCTFAHWFSSIGKSR